MTKLLLFLICSLVLASNVSAEESTTVADEPLPQIAFTTNMGEFVVEINETKAPLTANNIFQYVDEGFYDGTIFHRVIDEFMIQGGGFTWDDGKLAKKESGEPVMNEAKNGLSNLRGTVAMARTNDPHSAKAQFFVNIVDNTRLDHDRAYGGWGYTVFGEVISGMEVIDAIAKVKTKNIGPQGNVPIEPVVIESARRVEASAEETVEPNTDETSNDEGATTPE